MIRLVANQGISSDVLHHIYLNYTNYGLVNNPNQGISSDVLHHIYLNYTNYGLVNNPNTSTHTLNLIAQNENNEFIPIISKHPNADETTKAIINIKKKSTSYIDD